MTLTDDYTNLAYIPGAEGIIEGWQEQAREWREIEVAFGRARLNVAYGDNPRQGFDLFMPSGRPEGTVVFVHGGYWQRFDKFHFSHFAGGVTAREWCVAMLAYDLAPDARVSEISGQIRQAVIKVAETTRGPIVLAGHSAGGHLVARLLCADRALPADVAARIVNCVAISPVGDLRPLVETSFNDALGMDLAEATAESPTLQMKHLNVPVTIWVGAEERPVFIQQSRDLAKAWGAELVIEGGRHHLDIIDGLRDADHGLTQRLF